MKTMKAVVVSTDTQSFQYAELDTPTPSSQDILVRVLASSINPVDLMVRDQREGQILGWDAVGEVVDVGDDVKGFQAGDRVFYAGDINRPGSQAEFQAVDYRLVGHAPMSLAPEQSAGLPLTGLTAWEALFEQAQLKPGETVLIINGSGGVGSIAIQLARRAGATVIATASRPETQEWVRKMGAHHVVNHHKDLVEQTKEFGPVQVIFCCHDTATNFDAMAEVIAPFGRIVSIVPTQSPLPMDRLFGKAATFSWELMFTKSSQQTPNIASQGRILNALSQMIDRGELQSTTQHTLPLSPGSLSEAHQMIAQGKVHGKLTFKHTL